MKTENTNDLLTHLKELQKNVEAVEEMLEPKMYVLTQSGRSIVPVDVFYADGVGTDDFLIIASHRGDKRWNILGAYDSAERATQVYEDMLRCPKATVFKMPPR